MGDAKIYTHTGDQGMTSLCDGTRVSKQTARIEAMGALDEANASIGAARALMDVGQLGDLLGFVQHKLYACSACTANPISDRTTAVAVTAADLVVLEQAIDRLAEDVIPLQEFILPGGTPLAATLHVARTVARRAERRLVALAELETVDEPILAFVNRLSDLLFLAARYANHEARTADIPWDKYPSAPTR